MTSSNRFVQYLDGQQVAYECRWHPRDETAKQAAHDSNAHASQFAKAIAVNADGGQLLVVLPANHRVDLPRLREHLGASMVELLPEEDLGKFFPDCEVGAIPALGHLFGMPVYISPELAKQKTILFHGGTHEHVIEMAYSAFEQLVKPTVADFSSPDNRPREGEDEPHPLLECDWCKVPLEKEKV